MARRAPPVRVGAAAPGESMRHPRAFIRNLDADVHLEIFLVAAVAAILGIRLYLKLAGYPQLGGGSLHIAHMLWAVWGCCSRS